MISRRAGPLSSHEVEFANMYRRILIFLLPRLVILPLVIVLVSDGLVGVRGGVGPEFVDVLDESVY